MEGESLHVMLFLDQLTVQSTLFTNHHELSNLLRIVAPEKFLLIEKRDIFSTLKKSQRVKTTQVTLVILTAKGFPLQRAKKF